KHPMTMRLYIDEYGNSDLQGASADPNVRYLALTGVLARRAQHDQRITPAVEHIKRHFRQPQDGRPVVLHRRDLMRREGPFVTLHNEDVRAQFDDELIEMLKRLPYLVNTVQIDKKAHLETYKVWHYEPYHYCLCCLVERYVLYLERHGLQGDVIVEQRGRRPDKKLKRSFRRIYDHGTDNIGPLRIQRALLSHDIGLYPKNANVAAIQIADLLAHPAARYMRFERDGIEHPNDFGGRIADVLVRYKFARHPATLKITGWGAKWLP
ncbi:MAG: DUF3800 domain-containing protein, partial [Vitreimonas sp.]